MGARFRRLYHLQRIRQQFRIASDDQRRIILDIANLPSSLERRIVDKVRIVFLGNRVQRIRPACRKGSQDRSDDQRAATAVDYCDNP